ncbi:DivIVA domain-containing protein [Streptomyces sp. NPDC086835]|uniref:DivIVA domain-containing protein n=1 Tax=Streptomyces sp. NPDC086835 TaxID=3365761 RepID=UPI0038230F23
MNPEQHHDGVQDAHITMSTGSGKTYGFAAIMQRLDSRSAEERDRLRAQADAAVLGHEAYALGHEYLERGNYIAARRWLRVAADRSVPGAEQALEEIDVRQSVDDLAGRATVTVPPDTAPCPTAPSYPVMLDSYDIWASTLGHLAVDGVTAAAQAKAQQITERADREADELLSTARRQMQREWAVFQRRMEQSHRTVAKLLGEAEQVQSTARQVREDAHHEAEVLLREAEQQAQSIIDDARARSSQPDTGPGHDFAANRILWSARMLAARLDPAHTWNWQGLLYDPPESCSTTADHLPERYTPDVCEGLRPLRRPATAPGTRADTAAVMLVAFDDAVAVKLRDPQPDTGTWASLQAVPALALHTGNLEENVVSFTVQLEHGALGHGTCAAWPQTAEHVVRISLVNADCDE